MTFHPDLTLAPRLPRSIVSPRSLPFIRLLSRLAIRGSKRARVVDVGGATVRVFTPVDASGPLPALLWIHGGGYVIGSAAMDDATCARFADRLGLFVVSVDYRLAPEHPFPTPLEDCYAGLRWLATRTSVDPDRIAVGGMSAGGGLAAALVQMAVDRGDVSPAFQLLVYPMLDDETTRRADPDPDSLRVWSADANRFGWSSYLGDDTGRPEWAAAARRRDLSGLPPAWIGVGSADLFHDEDLAYARRLEAAGVPCQVDVVDGAYHAFDVIEAKTAVARDFVARRDAALAAGLEIALEAGRQAH